MRYRRRRTELSVALMLLNVGNNKDGSLSRVSAFTVPLSPPSFSTKRRCTTTRTRTTRFVDARDEERPLLVDVDDDDDSDGRRPSSSSRSSPSSSRRSFAASSLAAVAAALTTTGGPASTSWAADLAYSKSPVNRRSGTTVFAAERYGYNVRFVTYLARFLLCFDDACQRWWYGRAADLPRRATAEEVDRARLAQFGAFSASVEVGLQEYLGPDGPASLMTSLLGRYGGGTTAEWSSSSSSSADTSSSRERREARRQIALLFGLMEDRQPVDEITRLLAAIDNARVETVSVRDKGAGYAPDAPAPTVTFSPPEAGEGYERAVGVAEMESTGRLLRVDVVGRGSGYAPKNPPAVTVSPPKASMIETTTTSAGDTTVVVMNNDAADWATAKAVATVYANGPNKGQIQRVTLTDPGRGYASNERVEVRVERPPSDSDASAGGGGIAATAVAVPELRLAGVRIVDGGSGYASEKAISVAVDPPAAPSDDLVADVSLRVPVVVGFPRADMTSFSIWRTDAEAERSQRIENAVEERSAYSVVRAATGRAAKDDGNLRLTATVSGGAATKPTGSSRQLLRLLPSGVGLEFDRNAERYALASADKWSSRLSSYDLDDPFLNDPTTLRGPIPVERTRELDLNTALRFSAAGALCSSSVHLALTPIDVVKTKVQTDPVRYDGVFSSLKTVLEEEGGLPTLFTGWAPTFAGFFLWGGVTYTLTETFRGLLVDAVGQGAAVRYEVPLVVVAAGAAALVGCLFLTPFEAVRIRSVAQPDYGADDDADGGGGGGGVLAVLARMVEEEGAASLFDALPAFLLKEIPFACAKFGVFDAFSELVYETYPAAREDLRASLGVSLLSGVLGGVVAAVVSNPADATVSEMKRARSDAGPVAAATALWERDGARALFKGLALRMFFYSLIVSLQFFVYDAIRFALGVGSDDLKLYLDVLGGALSQ